jgi:hypothetical protein
MMLFTIFYICQMPKFFSSGKHFFDKKHCMPKQSEESFYSTDKNIIFTNKENVTFLITLIQAEKVSNIQM